MKYQGGKSRLGKKLAEILEADRKEGQVYLEPFVGSGAVIEHMSGMRIGNDVYTPLIKMYHALQGGWIPPTTVTREEYNSYREQARNFDYIPDGLEAFVGIACSFAGKLWGGYAQGKNSKGVYRNYADEGSRSLMKQLPKINDVMFTNIDYKLLNPQGMLIYCDPPYAGTTGYKGTPKFDSEFFWEKAQYWCNQGNTVYVSEYTPPNFTVELVWEKPVKTTLTKAHNKNSNRNEMLFKLIKDVS